METAELREKLHHYIENAQQNKLQAIFTMVEDEIEARRNHWDDENFIAELVKREQSFLNGTANTYTVSEAASRANKAINQVNK